MEREQPQDLQIFLFKIIVTDHTPQIPDDATNVGIRVVAAGGSGGSDSNGAGGSAGQGRFGKFSLLMVVGH